MMKDPLQELLDEMSSHMGLDRKIICDRVRKKYVKELFKKTKRNILLYISGWPFIQGSESARNMMSISAMDLSSIRSAILPMEAGAGLDLIIQSPGGNSEAAEIIVATLRRKFDDIRVIIPHMAMSSATIIACAADRLLMGEDSYLGPTDPQLVTNQGRTVVAAADILADYERIRADAKKDGNHLVYTMLLSRFDNGMLTRCKNSLDKSRELVDKNLRQYMFKDRVNVDELVGKAVRFFNEGHKSHGQFISRESIADLGMPVEYLERDAELDFLVMCVFYATCFTISEEPYMNKLIENQDGRNVFNIV